ncbi:MAG TPA: glycosyltransferase family 87 protein [Planctomycetaceae bacterium]|nr:glycosyltransferase family 87 protein [Planctomycetaceae bacterium]
MLRLRATTPVRKQMIGWLPALIWALLLVVVSARILGGEDRTVTAAYHQAAHNWIAGETMYEMDGGGFLYLPQAAVLYIPFSQLPGPWGGIMWRVCGVLLLAWGVRRISQILAPGDPETHLGLAFFSALLCFSCLRNGQSTLHMTAAMLLSAGNIYRERWGRATFWLLIGFAIKPLIIVMILLAGAAVPRMRLRLAIGLTMVLLNPFLFQRPAYVAWQYQEFVAMLRTAHELGVETWWAQLFGMFRAFGLDVPVLNQTAIRLAAAFGTLGVCLLAFQRLPAARRMVWLYSLSAVYLLLFNPRTENNTYCLLGPVLGMFYVEELTVRNRRRYAGGLLVLALLTLGSYELGKFLTPAGVRPIWLSPLACCVCAVYLGIRLKSELSEAEGDASLVERECEDESNGLEQKAA